MVSYKITCLFTAEWDNVYKSLFGSNVHCYSEVCGSVGEFSFEDDNVKPTNLGPLVLVEILDKPSQLK
jgi:hypothetical protein